MIAIRNLPFRYNIVKNVGVIIPFARVVGMFKPLFDRQVIFHVGTLGITGGWVAFASIKECPLVGNWGS
jgi:cobalt/nickel transport system permease protein